MAESEEEIMGAIRAIVKEEDREFAHRQIKQEVDAFLDQAETLGAEAIVLAYSLDAGETWDGWAGGQFENGPVLAATIGALLKRGAEADPIAVCAAIKDVMEANPIIRDAFGPDKDKG